MKLRILISATLLAIIVIVLLKYCACKPQQTFTQAEYDALKKQDAETLRLYKDSLDFINGQLELQNSANIAHTDRIIELEKDFYALNKQHQVTKRLLKNTEKYNSDTGFVLAPQEYVDECEQCFTKADVLIKENVQLRFERDSYDTLMRQQVALQEKRINELDWEKNKLHAMLYQQKLNRPTCDITRKVKASLMGMISDPFLPKGGGFGVIYEDKKFNEYGGHVVFTGAGNIYLINVAKTISFKRKR